jgi:hypothetical protein
MSGLPDALRSLSIVLPKRHIFLLSHMRAYTSLFGHIMGSHPAICGYYEMHIGYYSWRSLVRQKLLYARSEKVKPGCSFMFDKVLHDDHEIAARVLDRPGSRAIFCLRHPRQTIPSIVRLYHDTDPSHDFASEAFAAEYYVRRLDTLVSMANSLESPFFYLDAERLVESPDATLGDLSSWLQLETPLSQTYDRQKKTSRQRYGDTSARLESGHIVRPEPGPAEVRVDQETLGRAVDAYNRARATLTRHSAAHCILD